MSTNPAPDDIRMSESLRQLSPDVPSPLQYDVAPINHGYALLAAIRHNLRAFATAKVETLDAAEVEAWQLRCGPFPPYATAEERLRAVDHAYIATKLESSSLVTRTVDRPELLTRTTPQSSDWY